MSSNAIEIRGLVKRYPAFTLGPVDLTVPRGAIYGLIGPNGAGKTTTIDLMLGMGAEDAGQIRVLGLDHRGEEVEMKRRLAYVGPDLSFQVWGKVGRTIQFVRGFYPDWDDAACLRLMETFRLHPEDRIATLSFGARTKLALLLALSRRPEVLLLDEPTTGLDAISRQEVFGELLKTVADGDRTVLISSHGLADLERFADHVGLIHEGRMLLEGRMDEVVERYRMADFFADEGFGVDGGPGITVVSHGAGRWRALLDQGKGAVERIRARGAREITLAPVTLEELFVALLKEHEPCPR